MSKRKLLSLVKPEIIEVVIWNSEKWVKEDGTEFILDPSREFIVEDEEAPELVCYVCKFGYRVIEEDNKLKILRIGFIEYEKEKSTGYMA